MLLRHRLHITGAIFLALLLSLAPGRIIKANVQTGSAQGLATHLVISEIYYNPYDEFDSEFVEFYNPTDSPIDLTGWGFQEKEGSTWKNFATDTDKQNELVVPPGGFLLLVDGGWSENRDDTDWPLGDVVDELSLLNRGNTVSVRDPDGEVVDAVTYAGKAGDGQSVERKAAVGSTIDSMRDPEADKRRGNAYDTDDFETDFVGPLPPDPQNSSSPAEFPEVDFTLTLTAEDLNLPADGSSETTLRIGNGVPDTEVHLNSGTGELSHESVVLDKWGEASLSLTAPPDPGVTTVIAEGEAGFAGTSVYFHQPGGVEVEGAQTTVIGPGAEMGEIDGQDQLGVEAVGARKGPHVDDPVAVTVGEYPDNPTTVHPLSGIGDRYFNVHSVNADSLSELTVKVYLDSWPKEPRARYWHEPTGEWVTCSNCTRSPEENSLTLKIGSSGEPSLGEVDDLKVAAGGLDREEIRVEGAGWNMVAIPLEPEVKDPGSVFSGLDPSRIYRWEGSLNGGEGGYITPEGYYNEVKPFEGLWIYVSEEDSPMRFEVSGVYDGSVTICLDGSGWHQIGVPFDYRWSDLGVERIETEDTLSTTEAAGEGLLWGYFWEWSPGRGRYYPRGTGVLEAGRGYWVNTKVDDLRLVVPYGAPPGTPDTGTQEARGLDRLTATDLPEPPPPPPSPYSDPDPDEEIECFAYPNPASGDLPVTFTTTATQVGEMRVVVVDALGGQVHDSGFVRDSELKWDLRNDGGRSLPNGLYLYRASLVRTDGRLIEGQVRKLLLMD